MADLTAAPLTAADRALIAAAGLHYLPLIAGEEMALACDCAREALPGASIDHRHMAPLIEAWRRVLDPAITAPDQRRWAGADLRRALNRLTRWQLGEALATMRSSADANA